MANSRGTAFSYGQWQMVNNTINQLRASAITHLRHGVKSKAVFDAFIHEEDKEPLQHVFKICDVNMGHQAFRFRYDIKNVEIENLTADVAAQFSITIEQHAKFKFLFPRYMAKAKMQKAFPELEEAFRLVASIYFEWARVREVLSYLNNTCETPAQVKTLCPSLPAMLRASADERTREWGDRLQGVKDSTKLPALDLQGRKQALYICQTITKGLLIPAESEAEKDEFTVGLLEATTMKRRWDGATWSAM